MGRIARKAFVGGLAIMLLLLTGCQTSTANQATDTQTSSQKTATARIVSTTVAGTKIFDRLGISLVGIPTSSYQLPERYQKVAKVGSPMGPDMEKIKSLHPTAVYATKTLRADQEKNFQAVGAPVHYLDFTSVNRMLNEITGIGKAYQKAPQAHALVAELRQQIKAAQKKIPTGKKVKVLVLMGVPGSYLVCTDQSYLGNLVKLAGGENVISGQKVEYLASNTEYLQAAQPDVILRAAHAMPKEVQAMFDQKFKTEDIWQHFNAVKKNRVYDLDPNLFGMTATLDSPKALKELVTLLYRNGEK